MLICDSCKTQLDKTQNSYCPEVLSDRVLESDLCQICAEKLNDAIIKLAKEHNIIIFANDRVTPIAPVGTEADTNLMSPENLKKFGVKPPPD